MEVARYLQSNMGRIVVLVPDPEGPVSAQNGRHTTKLSSTTRGDFFVICANDARLHSERASGFYRD